MRICETEIQDLRNKVLDSWLFYRLVGSSKRFHWRLPLLVLGLNFLNLIACVFENSVIIEGNGVGFFEDYGRLSHVLFVLIFSFSIPAMLENYIRFFGCLERDSLEGTVFQSLSKKAHAEMKQEYMRTFTILSARNGSSNRLISVVQLSYVLLVITVSYGAMVTWPSEIVSHVLSPMQYPISHIASIIWGIYGWGLLLAACLTIGSVLVFKTVKLTKIAIENKGITIIPASPDGAGGLRFLGSISYCFFWGGFSLAPFVVGAYFMPDIGLRMDIWLPIYLLILTFCVFYPLHPVYAEMKRRKYETMQEIIESYNAMYLVWEWKEIKQVGSGSEVLRDMENAKKEYDRARRMPVWPYDYRSIIKITTLVCIPIIGFAFDVIQNEKNILNVMWSVRQKVIEPNAAVVVFPSNVSSVLLNGDCVYTGDVALSQNYNSPIEINFPVEKDGYYRVIVNWSDGTVLEEIHELKINSEPLLLMYNR
ncbi:hypothetical protein [Cerasicoccus frondis]|uniref:hypothetical protein n=1 Tax=Cerasicoccus frondis TaxID=490090 RepID=UPI0028525996|nr:hypothetical protein [Cerasicoccus frondis]